MIGLMQAFDLLENDIIVIGATNRKDMIDEALIRRFSIQHEVKTLNNSEAYNLVNKFLKDLKIEYNYKDILSYVETHHKQSEIIKDIIKSIVKMLNDNTEFTMINDI